MSKLRILFLSAPIGAGHIRAAQAVSQVLQTDYGCQTVVCNVFDFFPRWLGQTILAVYLKILEIFPALYGTAYGWGNQSRAALLGRELISRYLAGRMLAYIREFQPALIVCTHATPAGLVAWLKRQGCITVPAAAVITDFVVHRLWVYREIDYYFVAHKALACFLQQFGIADEAITVTGIPISAAFGKPGTKSELLAKLKLTADRKTIVIMGGGAGILPLDKILEACSQLPGPLQVVAIAGKNQLLYQKLLPLAAAAKHPVSVLGFVDNVHEYLSIADLFISKPGGMSAAEALAKAVPLLIFRPIPGQEEGNTRFLLEHQAACRADSLEELQAAVQHLLLDENNELDSLRQQAARLGRPQAAAAIAKIMVEKINNY